MNVKLSSLELQIIRASLRVEMDSLQQAIDNPAEDAWKEQHIKNKLQTGVLLLRLSALT